MSLRLVGVVVPAGIIDALGSKLSLDVLKHRRLLFGRGSDSVQVAKHCQRPESHRDSRSDIHALKVPPVRMSDKLRRSPVDACSGGSHATRQ